MKKTKYSIPQEICEHLYRDASDTRFCVDCGKRLNNNSRCPKCGHETDTQDECYEWDCEYVRQNGECQKCRNDFEGEPRW